MSEVEFFDKLKQYRNRNILYLCHQNADCDAIGSAYALASVFGGTIGVIDTCNRTAAALLKALEAKVEISPDPSGFEFTVIVDTATKDLLGNLPLEKYRYALIDHHEFPELIEKAEFYIHRSADATAELIYDLFKHNHLCINKKIALALIAGIVTDTGHFKHASAASLRKVAEMLEQSGLKLGEVIDILANLPMEISGRIAILKAAERVTTTRINDYLIATSQVSAYRDAAAAALVNIGADIAFVGSEEAGETKISSRARREVVEKGLNLALLVKAVAEKFGGSSGGHEGAAALAVKAKLEVVIHECIEEGKNALRAASCR
jgi:nanoRNase/pAp phosphatase (c-di-AMP/oligoRNAs hydrolase)